jgi:hypothetical protein
VRTLHDEGAGRLDGAAGERVVDTVARNELGLALDDEPQWTARLLELAVGSEKNLPTAVASLDSKPALPAPATVSRLLVFEMTCAYPPFCPACACFNFLLS